VLGALVLSALALVGSAGGAHGQEPPPLEASFTYLGAGGWLIRMGDAAVLTAPFFSNPGLVEVGIGRLATDTAAVDRFLPPVEDVPAILVGHAHYDHLMDVPYVARVHAREARVYGTSTAVNLLRGDPEVDPGRLVAVSDGDLGTHEKEGRWFETADGRVRFMPLRSEHAPHLLGIRLFHGEAPSPRRTLPTRATEWLDGPTLAWLIDVLGPDGEVLLRVHYQDASSRPPLGFPPPDGRKVDVVILCVAGSDEAPGYPEALLEALRPSVALLGHWEDFFRPLGAPVRPVPGTDVGSFEERVADHLSPGAILRRPAPGEEVRVEVDRQRPPLPSSSRP
jgi:hypothetical protein